VATKVCNKYFYNSFEMPKAVEKIKRFDLKLAKSNFSSFLAVFALSYCHFLMIKCLLFMESGLDLKLY